MTATYPSTFLQQYPTKIAFLIDCTDGLNTWGLSPSFLDHFPTNSDAFFFYEKSEYYLRRRLKLLDANQRGKYVFATAPNGVPIHLSFILGQIHDKYTDFILITGQHAAYADLCRQLIANNARLKHHIQVRSFERLYEFEQFLQKMSQVPKEAQVNPSGTHVVHYSKEHLFHPCPFESREQSSNIYRFGELLYHLDTEHDNVKYEYCPECQTMIDKRNLEEANLLAKHIEEQHWKNDNGFQLSIRST